jgi:TolB protein
VGTIGRHRESDGERKACALAATVLLLAAGCGASDRARETNAVASTSAKATGKQEANSPDGLIAVAARGDIFVIDPGSGKVRRVTNGPAEDFSPSWFPDAAKLAFRRSDPDNVGASAIFEANLDGTGIRQAPLPQDAEDLTWSPDGRRIAYSGGLPGDQTSKGDILIADGDGTHVRFALGWEDSTDEFIAWSPDSRRIAFASNHGLLSDEVRTLWIADLATHRTRPLTGALESPYLSTDVHPAWSPDGRSIAFQSNRGTGDATTPAIWLVAPDGSGLHALGEGEFPAWSPDGTKLAFSKASGGVVIASANGSNQRTVGAELGYTPFVAWSAADR